MSPTLKARNPQLEWVVLENAKVGENSFAESRDGAMLAGLCSYGETNGISEV